MLQFFTIMLDHENSNLVKGEKIGEILAKELGLEPESQVVVSEI